MNDERIRRMRIVALIENWGLFELEPDEQISILLLLRELHGLPPLDQDALDTLKAAVLEHEAAVAAWKVAAAAHEVADKNLRDLRAAIRKKRRR
jgi:hypothetical protein